MRQYNYIAFIFVAFVSINAFAQKAKNDSTLNRTVVVEQEYNPDILDASKINMLPKVEEPSVAKKGIEYSTVTIPVTSFGTYQEIQPFISKEEQAKAKRGYVRLGYGNYGNLDGKASYLFDLSKKDRLGIAAGIDGMDGKFAFPDGKHQLRYYQSNVAVNYLHRFDKMNLDVAGNWGLSNFNFHPDALITHQRFTSGDVHFGVNSTDETLPVQFKAETNLMLYSRAHNVFHESPDYLEKKINETMIHTKADVSGAINDEQKIGIALQMDNLFYTKDYSGNYTSLLLNPYYELNNDSWKMHLGANVDFSLGFGKALQASPDITIQYVFSDSYLVYAKAVGGRQMNDFRRLEQFCPYAELLQGPVLENTYEQINTGLGFKASLYDGVWFHLFGGYQNLKDDLYQHNEDWAGGGNVSVIHLEQENTSNAYAGIDLSYSYKDYLKLSFGGTYYHWDASDEALVFKPSLEMNANIDVRPIKALLINVGYQYTQREKTKALSNVSMRLNPVSNFYVGATYNIYKGFSAFAKINNLLNKKYQYYYSYPVEGTNFLAGLSFSF